MDNEHNDGIDMVQDLIEQGYQMDDIDAAFQFILNLPEILKEKMQKRDVVDCHGDAIRVFSPQERAKLREDAQEWLLRLYGAKLLTADEFEAILTEVDVLELEEVGVRELKWILSQVVEDEGRAILLATTPILGPGSKDKILGQLN
jgi:uncharacterized protein Smg (DUF494 family)